MYQILEKYLQLMATGSMKWPWTLSESRYVELKETWGKMEVAWGRQSFTERTMKIKVGYVNIFLDFSFSLLPITVNRFANKPSEVSS